MNRKQIAVILLAGAATVWTAVPTLSANIGVSEGPCKQAEFSPAPPRHGVLPPHGEKRGPHHEHGPAARPPFDPALDAARQLSVTETYAGIKPAQMEAWRAYTTALLAMIETSAPAWPVEPENDDRHEPRKQPPLSAEMLADHAIATADKARLLKEGIKALLAVLSDEQIERLRNAEPGLQPPAPPMHDDAFGPPSKFPIPGED